MTEQATIIEPEWIVRPYAPEWDESALVYMWLKSYGKSEYARALGGHVEHSTDALSYWMTHRRVVMELLAQHGARVLCDPDRPEPVDNKPAIIWAWACVDPDELEVHYISVKRNMARAGVVPEMFTALVGDLVDEPCRVTHDLTELRSTPWRKAGVRLPAEWYVDEGEWREATKARAAG